MWVCVVCKAQHACCIRIGQGFSPDFHYLHSIDSLGIKEFVEQKNWSIKKIYTKLQIAKKERKIKNKTKFKNPKYYAFTRYAYLSSMHAYVGAACGEYI